MRFERSLVCRVEGVKQIDRILRALRFWKRGRAHPERLAVAAERKRKAALQRFFRSGVEFSFYRRLCLLKADLAGEGVKHLGAAGGDFACVYGELLHVRILGAVVLCLYLAEVVVVVTDHRPDVALVEGFAGEQLQLQVFRLGGGAGAGWRRDSGLHGDGLGAADQAVMVGDHLFHEGGDLGILRGLEILISARLSSVETFRKDLS